MTWKNMKSKYPESRHEMSLEREQLFVEDCFACYENEGFSKRFWTQGDDYENYVGKPFSVVGRVSEYDDHHKDGADLECLPMWKIRFEDGKEIDAYPDEIIVREMLDNGCPKEITEEK